MKEEEEGRDERGRCNEGGDNTKTDGAQCNRVRAFEEDDVTACARVRRSLTHSHVNRKRRHAKDTE